MKMSRTSQVLQWAHRRLCRPLLCQEYHQGPACQPAVRPEPHSGLRPESLVLRPEPLELPVPKRLEPRELVPELLLELPVRRWYHSFAFSSFRFSVYIFMYVLDTAASTLAMILLPIFRSPS